MNEIMADVLHVGLALGQIFLRQFFQVLSYPFHAEQRIFVVWLFTSLLFALFVFSQAYSRASTKNTSALSAFLRFLFPQEVYR